MRVSELIKDLQKLQDKHGDILVTTREDGMGGHAALMCGGVSKDTDNIYAEFVQYGGENEDVDDETIKKLFPTWDGDHESLDEMEPAKVAIILSGELIYCT